MKVILSPGVRKYVNQAIKSGRFRSPDEMIQKAVRNLMDRDRELSGLQASIDSSRAQLDRGEGLPLSQVTPARVRENALKRAALGKRRKAS